MKSAALLCARNEALHIESCLRDLLREGLEVVLIDHQSEDDTVERARRFLGRGLLAIESMPWRGRFSLAAQLRRKREIAAALDHDWVLHVDADEGPCSPREGETLTQALARADAAGATCVNFDEFVFLPASGERFEGTDYRRLMLGYYFYEPSRPRLLRAWRRDAGLDNVSGGGHLLRGGPVRIFAESFPLRHYICLSEAHARAKYLGRRYSRIERWRGWHANRVGIDEAALRLRPSPALRRLPDPDSRDFDRSRPADRHFWEWPPAGADATSA
jgi:glycosyltransferase involved in cell wall biosynthesis